MHLSLRQISMPMRVWIKFKTMSCQSTLRKTSPNKTRKTDDDATAATLLVGKTRLLGLNMLLPRVAHETCSKTWMKLPTMHSTVL